MVVLDSLHTKIYNHLFTRVEDLRVRELDYDRHDSQVALVSNAHTHAPGGIEVGPGTALFDEADQRREGRPRDLTEWGWTARFGFPVAVDAYAVMETLSADTLIPADPSLGTGPFRATLVSVTPQEQPRKSEETGTHFEVEFNLELQRR